MNIKSRLGRAGGIAAIAVAMGVGSVGLAGAASAAPVAPAGNPINGPVYGCVFQTVNGHYLTAVGGGGRTTDVIHTDATRIGSWEKFTLIDSGSGTPVIQYGLLTTNGHYLTAVDSGGRTTDVIHSNATQLLGWEMFTLNSLGGRRVRHPDARRSLRHRRGRRRPDDRHHPHGCHPRGRVGEVHGQLRSLTSLSARRPPAERAGGPSANG